MKIAVPIVADTLDAALRDIDEASKVADLVELRMDFLRYSGLTRAVADLQLLADIGFPKIITYRHQSLAGPNSDGFKGSNQERDKLLSHALSLKPEYVDVEAATRLHPQDFIPLVDHDHTKLILSYHDFTGTPKDLRGIYKRIASLGGDIVKIATTPHNLDDIVRIVIMIEQAEGEVIGISMGKMLLAGHLVYAALNEDKRSAPLQPTVAEYREFMAA